MHTYGCSIYPSQPRVIGRSIGTQISTQARDLRTKRRSRYSIGLTERFLPNNQGIITAPAVIYVHRGFTLVEDTHIACRRLHALQYSQRGHLQMLLHNKSCVVAESKNNSACISSLRFLHNSPLESQFKYPHELSSKRAFPASLLSFFLWNSSDESNLQQDQYFRLRTCISIVSVTTC